MPLNSFREKLRIILKATRSHARNLATFALIYKTTVLMLRRGRSSGKEAYYDTFLAGFFGGYYVFGRNSRSSVNQQIVIYVFARVVLALAKLSVQKGGLIPEKSRGRVTTKSWPVFAALSWGAVMWLFRWHSDTLQPSMRSSMQYMCVLSSLVLSNSIREHMLTPWKLDTLTLTIGMDFGISYCTINEVFLRLLKYVHISAFIIVAAVICIARSYSDVMTSLSLKT